LRTRGEANTQRDAVDAFVLLPLLGSRGRSASAMLAQTRKTLPFQCKIRRTTYIERAEIGNIEWSCGRAELKEERP